MNSSDGSRVWFAFDLSLSLGNKIISQIEYSYSSFIPVAVIKRSQNSLGEERKGFISAYRLQSIAEGGRNPMQKPWRSVVSWVAWLMLS